MRLVSFLSLLIACGGDDRPGDPDVGAPDVGADATDAALEDAGPCGVCEGATPLCDEDRVTCVACLIDDDCGGLTCSNGTCVGCTETDECLSPSASVCSPTGECIACVSDSGCAHLDGECVEGTCEPYAPPCTPCTESPECGPNGACIPMFFRGTLLDGSWCVRKAGPAGECDHAPFSTLIRGRASIERTRVDDWCGPDELMTTCTALAQAIAGDACSADDQCGVADLEDGVCIGSCTIDCGGDEDCPASETCSERAICE